LKNDSQTTLQYTTKPTTTILTTTTTKIQYPRQINGTIRSFESQRHITCNERNLKTDNDSGFLPAKEIKITQESARLYKLSIDGRFMTYTLPYETTNYKKVYFGGSSVVDYGDFIYYWIIDFNENDQTLIIRTFPLFGAYFDTPMYMFDA